MTPTFTEKWGEAMGVENSMVVIPARWASSRFPGKPLAMICGLPMIVRVAQNAMAQHPNVTVATDDERIVDVCIAHNVPVEMTYGNHPTGTDRVAELAAMRDSEFIVSVQGDELLLAPDAIANTLEALSRWEVTCGVESDPLTEPQLSSPSVPKVVTNVDRRIMYVSRAAIPALKDGRPGICRRQVCIYGFRRDALITFAANPRPAIELSEDVELLRMLWLGVPVGAVMLPGHGLSVDNPEDIGRADEWCRIDTPSTD